MFVRAAVRKASCPPRQYPTAPILPLTPGRARSVSEVYSVLSQRFASAAASPATQSARASVGGDIKPTVALANAVSNANAVSGTPVIDTAPYLSTFPDARSTAPVIVSRPALVSVAPA